MKRGLILLVSGQAVPNLQALFTLQPDKAWLLVTPGMARRNDRWFVRAVAESKRVPPGGIVPVRVPAAHLPGPTAEAVRGILQRNPGWSWDIMLAGGTKPMALGAWQAAVPAGARPWYMDPADPGSLLELRGGRTVAVPGPLSLEVFLAAHGYAGEGDASPWSRVEVDLAGRIARHADRPIFREEDQRLDPGVDPGLARELVRRIPGLADGSLAEARWRVFLSGGWLEVFLWSVLRDAADKEIFRDVTRGLRIVEAAGEVRNEIDVAAMHLRGLVAIEAKSGSRVGEDAVYKFATVLHQVRALGIHGVLVVAGAGSSSITSALRRRAELLGIRLLDGDDVKVLAERRDGKTVLEVLGLPVEGPR